MTLYNVLDAVEDRLLQVHLFFRYFDSTDLEFLGFEGSLETEFDTNQLNFASRG